MKKIINFILKLYMIPFKKKDKTKNNSLYSLFLNYSKIENLKTKKNNPKISKENNNSKKTIKKRIDDNILNNSKLKYNFKPKTPIQSNDNSFNNSFITNRKKRENKNGTILTNKSNLMYKKINSNLNILYIKKKDNKKISNKKLENEEKKIINDNLNYNYKRKIDNFYSGINILNYKKIAPNIKKSNHNNSKSLSGQTNKDFSYNNSGILNISSIDHFFYRPITNISSLNKMKNKYRKIISSNISPINNMNNNSKLNNSDINKENILINNKKNDNLYIQKKYSIENIKKGKKFKINTSKNNEINYKKKKKNDDIFKPKNIFSKFKSKKNNIMNKNGLFLNLNFLINENNTNKQKNNNTDILINGPKFEGDEKYNNNNIKIDKKELLLNNNKPQINNNLLKITPNNLYNQINSHNILSYTTLNTGTDNYNNNQSQNIIDYNNLNRNNSNIIFKGKKIRCIHDISKTGLSGEEKKVNQDRYFIFRNFVNGYENIFMGVLDGHGYYGQEVSEYIKENLPMDLNRVLKTKKINLLKDDLSEVIKQTFEMENNSLLRNKQIDSNLSGSTCVSVIYTPEKLIIANIGDSRCVLGKKIDNDEWKAENLTKDHKPDVPEEAERIMNFGGRIRPMKDEEGNYIGPLRVYMKDKDIPGLAMTRSFGDYYASTAGTISIPEVSEYKFAPEDKFLILASDGLFEFIDSDEVVNIVSGYYEKNDIVGCCEFLYKESYRKWIYEEEDTVDDITIILVFFEE